MCMSKMYMGEVAGEIAQWVKALTALPYRQGSIPSIYITAHSLRF